MIRHASGRGYLSCVGQHGRYWRQLPCARIFLRALIALRREQDQLHGHDQPRKGSMRISRENAVLAAAFLVAAQRLELSDRESCGALDLG